LQCWSEAALPSARWRGLAYNKARQLERYIKERDERDERNDREEKIPTKW
jgi:hypothetical protein